MAWTKSSPELMAYFSEVAPAAEGDIEHRKMFGYPACFVGGNMFMGLFEETMILRLPPEERELFIREEGGMPFSPTEGREMKAYAAVPKAMLADAEALAPWVAKALAFGRTFPAKVPKAKVTAKKVRVTG